MLKVIDGKKVSEELLGVLVKNEVPIDMIDSMFDMAKNLAYHRTTVQNDK